ncbi:MAG: hypothetical protein ACLFVO_10345 [Chloroflexaceae bacterium]
MDHESREVSEHRETTSADMDQAILHSAGDITSGRAEGTILFHKKFAS